MLYYQYYTSILFPLKGKVSEDSCFSEQVVLDVPGHLLVTYDYGHWQKRGGYALCSLYYMDLHGKRGGYVAFTLIVCKAAYLNFSFRALNLG